MLVTIAASAGIPKIPPNPGKSVLAIATGFAWPEDLPAPARCLSARSSASCASSNRRLASSIPALP